MRSMRTAQTSQKLVAALAAFAATFAIVGSVAHLGYPAAQPAPVLMAANHAGG